MNENDMNFVIFDLEWNNAYNYKAQTGMNEIIEIGAVMLDERLQIVDTFKQLILPKVSKRLTGRFKDLTHITPDEVKQNGIPFEEAFSGTFARWSGADNCVFMSWSDSDLYVLAGNYKYFSPACPCTVYAAVCGRAKVLYALLNR